MGLNIFIDIRKIKSDGDIDFNDYESRKRFIKINYIQEIQDWQKKEIYTKFHYPAKKCEQKDFGFDEGDIKMFKLWDGFDLYCPDIHGSKSNNIMLQGVKGDMFNKNMIVSVEKCQNTTSNNNQCASPEEIEEYVHQIVVNTWVIQKKIDF